MKLFKVVDTKTMKNVKDGFITKSLAKKYRDKLNGTYDDPPVFRHVVARSSDHLKGPSNMTNREKKRSW